MLDSYFGQQQYVIYCSQLRATPSADCNISHIAVGLSNYLIHIALVQLLSSLIADEDFNSMFGYIRISKNKAFLLQDLTYKSLAKMSVTM